MLTWTADLTFNSSSRRKWLPSLLSGVLLLLQVAGVHLHLCFDGQEPPVTVHLLDSGPNHVPGTTASDHQDRDVDRGSASFIKKALADYDSPPIAYAAFASSAVLPQLRIPQTRWSRSPVHDVTRLLPPLRGPPETTLT